MSKKLIRLACLVLLMVLCLGPVPQSHSFLAMPQDNSVAANARSITVEVTFDGIMVFRKVTKGKDHYEVGILDKSTAPDHEFSVFLDKKQMKPEVLQDFLKKGNIWKLEIVTTSGTKDPDIWERNKKDCNRQQDTTMFEDLDHAYDFCWIMDLETHFHNQELKLSEGKLKPIIWLNNGELYTKFKYDQLQRKQYSDASTWSDFGFVAETLALQIKLRANETLRLRIEGTTEKVFELPKDGSIASIFNAPPAKKYTKSHNTRKTERKFEPSHFKYYYGLFPQIAHARKYDIQPKKDGLRPINRFQPSDRRYREFNDIRRRSFDNQACGTVLLGMSNDSLK